MRKTQEKVDRWIKTAGGYWEPRDVMLQLQEECGELAREVNHRFGPKRKKKGESVSSIDKELGDILFTLSCLANPLQINLEKTLLDALRKYSRRDRNRYGKRP